MRFSVYFTLVAVFGAGLTFAVPNGLPPLPDNIDPGVHSFNFDSDGNMKIKRVADLDTTKRSFEGEASGLQKRVNTWTGCEGYSFTQWQRADYEDAWAGLMNWASSKNTGASPWISGHYFAMTDSGTFAYLCEWGSGNHATTDEVNQAHAILTYACNSGPGIFQWNEWKKGLGIAATGQKWCNGVSPA